MLSWLIQISIHKICYLKTQAPQRTAFYVYIHIYIYASSEVTLFLCAQESRASANAEVAEEPRARTQHNIWEGISTSTLNVFGITAIKLETDFNSRQPYESIRNTSIINSTN